MLSILRDIAMSTASDWAIHAFYAFHAFFAHNNLHVHARYLLWIGIHACCR